MYSKSLIGFVFAIGVVSSVWAEEQEFVVAGYLPEYRLDSWQPSGDTLTDIVFFSLSVDDSGQLDTRKFTPVVARKLASLREQTNSRMLVTVGGWGRSGGFAKMATDDSRRSDFVAGLVTFTAEHDFDGVDYDWEHPSDAAEITAYSNLVVDTKAGLPPGKMVTVAMAPWNALEPALFDAVDRIHLMSYDHGFPQATFGKSQADVDAVVKMGCPAAKIALGIPFYGRNEKREAKTWAELAGDPAADPATNTIQGFAANGPDLVARKVKYAKATGLCGVMIWEIGQDSKGDQSLLRAIKARAF